MTFTKYVQIGRIAYIAIGPNRGNLCVIVDVIDQNRVLVDGPTTNVKRQAINLKVLQLTKFRILLPPSAREGTVRKAWEKAEINKKWNESQWAKKIAAQKLKSSMTDFDRFKLMKAKQARNRIISLEAGKLRLKARKDKKPAAPKKAAAAKKPVAKK